jgi:hypothetical protein
MRGSAALLVAMAACNGAIACELPPGGQELANRDHSIALSYRPDPAGLAVDRQFSLIVHVCARTPAEGLNVDAHMPEHRHGMNYKPTIALTAPGAWRADGLLLHMPGKWEFLFGVRVDGKTERLAHAVQVR